MANEVDRIAELLLATWKQADPKSSVALHPVSFVATFADMAKAIIEDGNTRTAAPVEGLERYGFDREGEVVLFDNGAFVLYSQAEAIIAAERAENARLMKINEDHCRAVNTLTTDGARLDGIIRDLKTDNAALTARVKELGAILEGDRTKVTDLMNAISDAFIRRSWLLTSRGSYEWDDDGFRKEFGDAMEEIGVHVETMRSVGRDWSNCPVKADEIVEARIDWRNRAEALETKLAALKDAAKSVEDWWLSEGMNHFPGAPYCIFAIRAALEDRP